MKLEEIDLTDLTHRELITLIKRAEVAFLEQYKLFQDDSKKWASAMAEFNRIKSKRDDADEGSAQKHIKTPTLVINPDNPTEVWYSRGRRPKWLQAMDAERVERRDSLVNGVSEHIE